MRKLYEDFLSNVADYPALADALAETLGVSAGALRRLGLGFDPTTGTWVFPEYDIDKTLIGLVRRYPNGKKYCVEGSKRGLALDPEHTFVETQPILVVEGHSDAAAALTLGCQVVGRPCATGGFNLVKTLTEGFDVLVVGENDGGVGITSVPGLIEQLRPTCRSVSSVLPPSEYKDLRQWLAGGVTKEELEAYADSGTIQDRQLLVLQYPEIRAIDLAEHWLKATYYRGTIPLLRNYRGEWYAFNGSCYGVLDEDESITSSIHQHYRDVKVSRPNNTGKGVVIRPVDITTSRLASIKKALLASCTTPAAPPCWFDLSAKTEVSNLIPFTNGYLDVIDWSFHAPTPGLFITATLPYAYQPEAVCPRWLSFLTEIFPDDPAKADLLQEWLGYLLVADTSYEKYMLFSGLSGGGKGTTIHAMMAVLGKAMTVAMSLQDFASTFGLQKLVGKYAAFASDAHITDRTDSTRVVELLKAVVGRDAVSINRKFKTEITKYLTIRLTMAADHIPELPDDAAALRRRLLVLSFTESFSANPDPRLKQTLASEAPGICLWALEGLKRLQSTGKFTEPVSTADFRSKLERMNSPIRAFIDECCVAGADLAAPLQVLFSCWRGYCRDNRSRSMPLGQFEHRFLTTVPGLSVERDETGATVYRGVALRSEAELRYVRFGQ